MKKCLLTLLIFLVPLQAQAFEDCVITTNGKLTDISIEDNTIIDVCPLVTIMNNKNTLIVSPLKVGKTRFCVLKNNKDIIMFNVEVKENKTIIEDVKGFDILAIDVPFEEFVLDLPPIKKEIN